MVVVLSVPNSVGLEKTVGHLFRVCSVVIKVVLVLISSKLTARC